MSVLTRLKFPSLEAWMGKHEENRWIQNRTLFWSLCHCVTFNDSLRSNCPAVRQDAPAISCHWYDRGARWCLVICTLLRWIGQSNVIGCEAVCDCPEDMEELEKLQPSTHHCPESKRDYMQLEKMGKERVFLHCNDTFWLFCWVRYGCCMVLLVRC